MVILISYILMSQRLLQFLVISGKTPLTYIAPMANRCPRQRPVVIWRPSSEVECRPTHLYMLLFEERGITVELASNSSLGLRIAKAVALPN